jgi:two-component system sensor histidine kinase BarA
MHGCEENEMLSNGINSNLKTTKPKKVIDWQQTVKLVNDKPKLAEEMLSMLIAELPATEDSILKAVEDQDPKLLHKYVHRLHGACCYIVLPNVKPIVMQIETKLKSGQNIKDLSNDIAALLAEIQQVKNTYESNHFQEEIASVYKP